MLQVTQAVYCPVHWGTEYLVLSSGACVISIVNGHLLPTVYLVCEYIHVCLNQRQHVNGAALASIKTYSIVGSIFALQNMRQCSFPVLFFKFGLKIFFFEH